MSTNGRIRTLAALGGEPVDGFPIWLMRQAGRFLPEYRDIRAHTSFLELVRSPSLCREAAMQPLRRFDLDATIVFSDILVIPDALGAGLSFTAGNGPRIARPLQSDAAVDALRWDGACDRLGYVYEAVAALRTAAPDHALFGFAGSPWTLFCYLTQGAGGGEFAVARTALWSHPARSARVLDLLADVVAEHLLRQITAGADVVQVFDTWGGLLPAEDWKRHTAPGLRRIAQRLGTTPCVLYIRAGGHLVAAAQELGFTALSVDSTVDLASVRGPTQGNLDNTRLLGTHGAIDDGVRRIHAALGGRRDHVFNLGHGVLPSTPPEAVTHLVEAVRRLG